MTTRYVSHSHIVIALRTLHESGIIFKVRGAKRRAQQHLEAPDAAVPQQGNQLKAQKPADRSRGTQRRTRLELTGRSSLHVMGTEK